VAGGGAAGVTGFGIGRWCYLPLWILHPRSYFLQQLFGKVFGEIHVGAVYFASNHFFCYTEAKSGFFCFIEAIAGANRFCSVHTIFLL
jgi:hypothetical protein